jgi:putative acetyltransferase
MPDAVGLTILIEDPGQPELLTMLADSDAYFASLYPPESNHLLGISALRQSSVTFFVARIGGRPKGFGSIVESGTDYAEIKRMFVDASARGHGLGRSILAVLEGHARAKGLACLRLETGVKQPEALSLYRSSGYRDIGPFGSYKADPLSVFMEKRLDERSERNR